MLKQKQTFHRQETDGLKMKEPTNGECVGGVRTALCFLLSSETLTHITHTHMRALRHTHSTDVNMSGRDTALLRPRRATGGRGFFSGKEKKCGIK